MTDIRNGDIYATLSVNGRCWLAENLRYGAKVTMPTQLQPMSQTDNCTYEKYCPPTDPDCNSCGGLYQWNELVQYGQTSAPFQGLCPPGWHVPTSQEWQNLIDAIVAVTPGDGIAGSTLADQNPAFGFHAFMDGIYYLNNTWAFETGNPKATMFWTSTLSGDKPIARGLNSANPSVSYYESSRANAFPVRCVMDL
jgi:uncharacterized protein (TIGR02145 family)